jgi:hypothetical protein
MSTLKSPLAVPYYAETTEEQEKLNELKEARQRLKDALENRNQLFDPTLLAMAQGFLAPTKTGKFGESLGNVAAAVMPVQQAEEKRSRELAQMQAELAALELAGVQAGAGEKLFRSALLGTSPSGAPGGTPSGAPAAAPGTPSGAPGGTPSGEAMRPINEDDIRKLMVRYPDKAKQLMELVKLDRDRFMISMSGTVFDRKTQKYLDEPVPGQEQKVYETPFGQFSMTAYQYSQYEKAEKDGTGKEYLEKLFQRTLGKPEGVMSVEERTAATEAKKKVAAGRAEAEADEEKSLLTAGAGAQQLMMPARGILSFATDPKNKASFGVIAEPTVVNAVAELVKQGISTPFGSIGLGGIDEAVANLKLSPEQKRARQLLARDYASLELAYAQTYLKGQGAVSNNEREIVRYLGGSLSDTAEAAAAKAKLIIARAEFDRKIRSEFLQARKQGQSIYDFKESDAYTKAVADLDKEAEKIRNELTARSGSRPASTTAPSGPAGAGARVRQSLGIQ